MTNDQIILLSNANLKAISNRFQIQGFYCQTLLKQKRFCWIECKEFLEGHQWIKDWGEFYQLKSNLTRIFNGSEFTKLSIISPKLGVQVFLVESSRGTALDLQCPYSHKCVAAIWLLKGIIF